MLVTIFQSIHLPSHPPHPLLINTDKRVHAQSPTQVSWSEQTPVPQDPRHSQENLLRMRVSVDSVSADNSTIYSVLVQSGGCLAAESVSLQEYRTCVSNHCSLQVECNPLSYSNPPSTQT